MAVERIVLDDRLLIEELLAGLPHRPLQAALHTTSLWYFRACRAAVLRGGGQLSGPFEQVDKALKERATVRLLELRSDIDLPDPRAIVPAMAEMARRHPRLNLLNLEAAASALVLSADVWLSEPTARGVLPDVLDAEGVGWRTVSIG